MQNNEKFKSQSIFLTIILIFYGVLTFIGAGHHEMWFDEAEAWEIASSNSLGELVQVLQSEGHPFLWYLVLKIIILLNLPCTFMSYVSWLFMFMTGVLIIYKAPFKAYTKLSILFSSGFIYFNCVMSRVYCLIPFILSCIALLYPKRKVYPVLYGLLIALLTNMHICVWGIVAVLGLNMVLDLIRDLKQNSLKQNFRSVIGLMVASLGVILLFVVMLSSLSTNQEVTSNSKTFGMLIESIATVLYDVALNGMSLTGVPVFVEVLFSVIFVTAWLLVVYCLRHNSIACLSLMIFTLGYMFVCGVVWFTIPNRAVLFFFVIVFSFWLSAVSNTSMPATDFSKILNRMTLPVSVMAVKLLQKIENNAHRVAEVAIVLILTLSAPVGIYYLFSDYTKEFSVAQSAAEYISEHYASESTVVVSLYDSYPQACCYIPEYKFYAIAPAKFYTYHDHTLSAKDMDDYFDSLSAEDLNIQLRNALGDKKLLFLNIVNTAGDKDALEGLLSVFEKSGDIVFTTSGALPFACKGDALILVETDITRLVPYLKDETGKELCLSEL